MGKNKNRSNEGPQKEATIEGLESSETGRLGVYLLALGLFGTGLVVAGVLTYPLVGPFSVIVGVVVGAALATSIRLAAEWEHVVILRFGRFHRIAGPGVYFLIPFADYAAACVDQRVRIMSFTAEAALTRDLVPVDIDAAIFWLVWDAQKACLEVENYPKAVLWSAQTAMRDAIGKLDLAELSPRRKQIDVDLQKLLGEKCEDWGISVMSVEIRNITVPEELQDALSREAQAQSERNARVLLRWRRTSPTCWSKPPPCTRRTLWRSSYAP